MSHDRLDEAAVARISGPAWEPLREPFLTLSQRLLGVSEDACAVLTTIYVKFQVSSRPNAPVYAVAWLKSSRQIEVGLALPADYDCPGLLRIAPKGTTYRGLTRYFVITPGESLSPSLNEWSAAAYRQAQAAQSTS